MHIIHRRRCRVCGNNALLEVINLGDQYLQGSFVKPGYVNPPRRRIPLQLVQCDVTQREDACGLLQLAHTLPPEVLYANYWYRSGTNATMRDHLKSIAAEIGDLLPGLPSRVLDIGCNDGTLLSFYPEKTAKFGVDPSDIAREIEQPVTVISSVFPSPAATAALEPRSFDAITSIAMYYDLEDPVGFARAVRDLLAPNGIWVLEMSYLPLMLQQNSFDTICHEHLEYYSLSVIEQILEMAGLRVFRVELNDINGGSLRCYVCHGENIEFDRPEWQHTLHSIRIREFELELDSPAPYRAFQSRIEEQRRQIHSLLEEAREAGKTVHIYGASTKGNVLLQWYGIDKSLVPYAAERSPSKVGARTLGTDIEIISEEQSRTLKPDYYLVLPWHFKREFLRREAETIRAGTRMVFPLPEVSIVGSDNLEEAICAADEEAAQMIQRFWAGRQ